MRPSSSNINDGQRQSDGDSLFFTIAWIAEQIGCSLSGAYVVAKDIGIHRLGHKRRLVRVLRSDFDDYMRQRREVVTGG